MVQMLRNGKYKNAQVFIRVMPQENMRWDYIKILNDNKTIYARALQDFEKGYENRVPHYWNFCTDGVFYNLKQEDIYKTIVTERFLKDVLQGNDAIILAYGQTGSGKSITINGMYFPYEERGIAPRLITELFEIKNNTGPREKVSIYMSYIETKGYYAIDLLNDKDNLLDINSIKNVSILKVDNEIAALTALFKAEGRRDVNEHNKYTSNNATGILTLEVITYGKKKSKIHLVDMAGADTIGNITCFYKRIIEIGQANVAKTQLEQFLLILCENVYERIVIKQRLNILITYLKSSLNTNSFLRFIGHVRTNLDNMKLTLSMLRFSQIILGLKFAKPLPDIENNIMEEIPINVKKIVEQMKTERILEEMFNNPDIHLNTNIDQERVNHIRNFTNEYLNNKIDIIVPLNVSDINLTLQVFKELYKKLEEENKQLQQKAYEATSADLYGSKSSFKKIPSITSKRSKTSVTRTTIKKVKSTESKTPEINLPAIDKDERSVTSFRKQSSVKSFRKMSGEKRRSVISESGLNETITEEPKEAEIPEAIPTYEDAWNLFIINENYNYDKLNQTTTEAEENTRTTQKIYLEEVNALNEVNNILLLRKNEVNKIQMRKDLKIPVSDELESQCYANLQVAQCDYIKQQEVVLKWQAELRIALGMLQQAKFDLKNEFERFCIDKYKTVLPVTENEFVAILKPVELKGISTNEDREYLPCVEKFDNAKFYVELQNLMRKEAMEKRMRCKHKKWINTVKIN